MTAKPNDGERTNSLGLFNMAEAYRLSAHALAKAKVRTGFAGSVIRFCCYHALELYLKALLRRKHSVAKIKNKFGHDAQRLLKAAEALGLAVNDEDREVFAMMDIEAIIEARYIKTGAKHWPEPDALLRTCNRVRDSVGALLSKAGVLVQSVTP
jgi:HEPN domain-containing protein